jgi:hypothetical protein
MTTNGKPEWEKIEQSALDKERTAKEVNELKSVAEEDGFKSSGFFLVIIFARGMHSDTVTEPAACYSAAQARNEIKHRLAEGWRVVWRIFGELHLPPDAP